MKKLEQEIRILKQHVSRYYFTLTNPLSGMPVPDFNDLYDPAVF